MLQSLEIMLDTVSGSHIIKGQGYYSLKMFGDASEQFAVALGRSPECNIARVFLGMSLLHCREFDEAQRHFQMLVLLTDFPKWLALGYNALGCIQAIKANMAEAQQLFDLSIQIEPDFAAAKHNLNACEQMARPLLLHFGSTELCC